MYNLLNLQNEGLHSGKPDCSSKLSGERLLAKGHVRFVLLTWQIARSLEQEVRITMNRHSASVLVVFVITFSMLVGCGAGVGKKQSVTGVVKLGGQPLDHGTIQFSPKPGTAGTLSGAEIKDGNYSVAREQGLDPGVYEVRIYSAEATVTDATAAPGESGPVAEDRIPPAFNAETTLEYTVAEGQPNEFNVDIP